MHDTATNAYHLNGPPDDQSDIHDGSMMHDDGDEEQCCGQSILKSRLAK